MDRKDVWFTGVLTGLGTLLSLFPLFAIQWLFDHIFDDADHSLLFLIALGLIAMALSTGFFLYLRHLMLLRLAGALGCQLQTALWKHLFQMPGFKLPSVIKKKLEDVERVKEHLLRYGPKILRTTFFSLFYLGAMAFFSFTMTLIALGVIGIDLLIFYSLMRKKKHFKKQIDQKQIGQSQLLTQSLCVLERIRASGAEGRIFKMWKEQSSQIHALKENLDFLGSALISLQFFVPLCILVLLLAAFNLDWITSSKGSFFAFYLAMINFCIALRDGIGSSLEEPSFKEEPARTFPAAEKITLKGEISVEGIADERGNTISFHLLPGEKISIPASSDLWTTQLVRYLLGFEQPKEGKIRFDGKELHELKRSHLRSQIGTVFRTKGVFVGTVWDNLVVGRNCSESDVEEALRLSGFDEDLKGFRMGYNTLLPEGGGTLSSGQKQRLLLARALCCRPAILILDQGIDALDSVSRKAVLDHLKELSCTQILISQLREDELM